MEGRGSDPQGRGIVAFEVNGRPVSARPGDTVASALIASSVREFRRTRHTRAPRGMFCGMGVCFDCVVTVDGQRSVPACMTPVRPGMRVELQ
jgi:aerobic-type carbon monoxide dehydrogenase small subunit (CoxS/CutS family)